jgi:hypothetical protein
LPLLLAQKENREEKRLSIGNEHRKDHPYLWKGGGTFGKKMAELPKDELQAVRLFYLS